MDTRRWPKLMLIVLRLMGHSDCHRMAGLWCLPWVGWITLFLRVGWISLLPCDGWIMLISMSWLDFFDYCELMMYWPDYINHLEMYLYYFPWHGLVYFGLDRMTHSAMTWTCVLWLRLYDSFCLLCVYMYICVYHLGRISMICYDLGLQHLNKLEPIRT